MPSFKATTAAEALTYDLRPYADAHGDVPEPSDKQVGEFYAGLASAMKDSLPPELIDGVDLTEPEQVGRLFGKLNAEHHEAMYGHLLDLHAAVCSHSPGRDQLEPLPYRLRQAWYGAVQGWLRPEPAGPATSS